MREYGQIQSSYWADPDIKELSDFGKMLGAYLLTSPHSNGLGCFRIPLGYVSEDFGKDLETVRKGFDELFLKWFLSYCEGTNFVLIHKFLRWNPISNPNVAKSRQKEFDIVPKKFKHYNKLCSELIEHGSHFEEPYRNRFETLSKQDPTQPNPDPSLSGKPDIELSADSPEGIISYLNQRSGKNFQSVESNLKFIRARMKEGRTAEEIRRVIDDRITAWTDKPKMQEYLRPGTLFNAEKFNGYFGNLGTAKSADWRRNIKLA